MIIQHNTGKTELCFVKVPGDAVKPILYKVIDYYMQYHQPSGEKGSFWKQTNVPLPSGNWQIVGNPFELSEEQCFELIKSHIETDYHDYGPPDTYNVFEDHGEANNAQEAFADLLDSLQIYQTNPYQKPPDDSFYTDKHVSDRAEWEQLELRTRSFILLKKI